MIGNGKIENLKPKTVGLRPDQIGYLKTRQKSKGIPQNETVRQALDLFMRSNPNPREK